MMTTLLKILFFWCLLTPIFVEANTMDNSISTLPIKLLSGEIVTLDQYKGKKPVYIKFWASWCQPCRHEMPELQKIYDQYGTNVQVLAINLGINDDLHTVEATQKEFGLTVPIAIDESGKLAQTFNLMGTPYHILLNKQGRVVYAHEGELQPAEIIALKNKLGLLTSGTLPALPMTLAISHHVKNEDTQLVHKINHEKMSAIFFQSTWCDWYLKDSRPAMAQNCVNAQQMMNQIAQHYPQIQEHGLVTRLWTGKTELEEYQKRFSPLQPVQIDETNELFLRFHIKQVPTLVLLKQGKEISRIHEFGDSKKVLEHVHNVFMN